MPLYLVAGAAYKLPTRLRQGSWYGSYPLINGYSLSVNGGASTSLTFDANGNMTSDGTNSYAWDCENRLIKVTYPGTNNYSSFVYDGYGRNVSIVETVAGSVTSTKQFIWSKVRMLDERDGTGAVTKQFFKLGQKISGTSYFYTNDRPGFSVRELTDGSANIQAQYKFDPYGQVTKISESVPADFGFTRLYVHARSGLNVSLFRAYNPALGRWLNRDPIGEALSTNLFAYVGNEPIAHYDPFGLSAAPRKKCPSGDDDMGKCQIRCMGLLFDRKLYNKCMFVCMSQNSPDFGNCSTHCASWGEPWTVPWIECMYICLGGDDEE